MFKPLFNVYEVICISDPTNFFDENYVLDNFKQYDFKSLHRFDKNIIIDPVTGKVYRKKNIWNKLRSVLNIKRYVENPNFSNYFEDGDITGIKMIHRLQFILVKYNSIESIFDCFDIYPSRVAWNGETTFFTKKCCQAYKYMINIVNENNYSTLFGHRLSKYFT